VRYGYCYGTGFQSGFEYATADECTFSLNATIHAADVAAAHLYRTAPNTIVVKAALEMLDLRQDQ
jgi:hypothetical protein